jgi:hypothetical protein
LLINKKIFTAAPSLQVPSCFLIRFVNKGERQRQKTKLKREKQRPERRYARKEKDEFGLNEPWEEN